MKIEMTDKQAWLIRFAIQILLDDETTANSDRKALEVVASKLDNN